ncbi:MAG: hypothetical protein ACR2PL_05830, partial [Dehalococcoidia bacterium]
MEFGVDSVFEAVKGPPGLVDDPERREWLERYLEAARVPLERAVFDLLSTLAESVDQAVSQHYAVRLSYRSGVLGLEVEPRQGEGAKDAADDPWMPADGEMEKVTIRIPAELKELVTRAATGSGLSLNSWYIRVLAGSLRA